MKPALLSLVLVLALPARSAEAEMLIYHPIQTDASGKIVPWIDPSPDRAYTRVLALVWNFWDRMRVDPNGLPYYMNHQVWNAQFGDPRGLGGDQFGMAMSSWRLYYAYTGNERVKANMAFIADTVMTRGLSPSTCAWPDIPFPYNTLTYSGLYDGDMRAGKDVTQPDKAGSFGLELVHLYKMSRGFNVPENVRYLEAAEAIADTLARHTEAGDEFHSPLPFKVNAFTGKVPLLRSHDFTNTWIDYACYTTNWAPTLELFEALADLHAPHAAAYHEAHGKLLAWMRTYPLRNNRWGPFFEDVDWWSDTQINAMTFARYIMEHRSDFPNWRDDARSPIEWSRKTFTNDTWAKYGVRVTNEQTVYMLPGESHTARQAADELLYDRLTGGNLYRENAIRALNWATYTVDTDGKNRFPGDEPWLTDGYGDYVRHYLRAMAAEPALAPRDEDHILSSTATVQQADYAGSLHKYYGLNFDAPDESRVILFYRTFETQGTEQLRLKARPAQVLLAKTPLAEKAEGEGYSWQPMAEGGGLLVVRRATGSEVLLLK
jgi:hypothetical protein